MTSPAPKSPTLVSSDEKWDHSLENFIRKSTIGLAIGVLPGLLLARSAAARSAIIALCTGVGSGIAYGEARYLFDHDIMFDKRHLIQLKIGNQAAQKSIE
jgi:MICOS complex subunit MIC10